MEGLEDIDLSNLAIDMSPQDPVQSVQSGQPVQPVQPVQPGQQVQPVQQVQPGQSGQQVQPKQPIQPGQQVQPKPQIQSVQPVQPGQSVQPKQPGQSIQVTKPYQNTPPIIPENVPFRNQANIQGVQQNIIHRAGDGSPMIRPPLPIGNLATRDMMNTIQGNSFSLKRNSVYISF